MSILWSDGKTNDVSYRLLLRASLGGLCGERHEYDAENLGFGRTAFELNKVMFEMVFVWAYGSTKASTRTLSAVWALARADSERDSGVSLSSRAKHVVLDHFPFEGTYGRDIGLAELTVRQYQMFWPRRHQTNGPKIADVEGPERSKPGPKVGRHPPALLDESGNQGIELSIHTKSCDRSARLCVPVSLPVHGFRGWYWQ